MRVFLVACALVTIALAGCSDGGGGGDSTSTSSSSGTTSSGTTTSTGPGGNGTIAPITGTVSGVADCTLEGGGASAASAAAITIPAGAGGRAYTLAFSGGQTTPTGFEGCIGFGTGKTTGGLTGTIPADATAGRVAVDGGQGVGFTLTIA